MCYFHSVRRNVEQTLRPFQNIRQMSQYIFHWLFGLVRYIRKKSKCRDIHKNIIIKSSCVAGKYLSIHSIICSFQQTSRDVKTACEVIRCSGRDIADRIPLIPVSLHHTGHNFIKRSVSSAAHDQIIFVWVIFFNLFIGITVCLRRICYNLISRFHKDINNICKFRF